VTELMNRYEWLIKNLEEVDERKAMTEEYEHFKNGPKPDDSKDAERFAISYNNLNDLSTRFSRVDLEISRAFAWDLSVHGNEYWTGVSMKYHELRQQKVRENIQALYAESRASAQDSSAHIEEAKRVVEEAKADVESHTKMEAISAAEREEAKASEKTRE
jgi:DNA-dependent RNA polymerase auxiliary subunit epsilon